MEGSFQTALMLMVIGMFTVFVILVLLVLCSKLMIVIINQYFPEISIPIATHQSFTRSIQERKKVSVILAAVEAITKGKGRVREIKKNEKK